MSRPLVSGNQVWCPVCAGYVQMLRVPKAASLADVSRRTVYRYIQRGSVHAVQVAGGTYRVCAQCLLRRRRETRSESDDLGGEA
jgi:excisionase family DNA binding protein